MDQPLVRYHRPRPGSLLHPTPRGGPLGRLWCRLPVVAGDAVVAGLRPSHPADRRSPGRPETSGPALRRGRETCAEPEETCAEQRRRHTPCAEGTGTPTMQAWCPVPSTLAQFSPPPKPKLRWYQYSLRSLLLLMLLVSLAMSWFTVRRDKARKQQQAAEVIQSAGGNVLYDYELDPANFDRLKISPPGPEWLRQRLGDDFFATVVHADVVDDEGLEKLHLLPDLQALTLSHDVTDAGLKHLENLQTLEELTLPAALVGDRGVEHIRALTRLRCLKICNDNPADTKRLVTDAALETIARLSRLEKLSLKGTHVTDAGLVHLKRLPRLREFDLSGTAVSDAGLKHLLGMTQLEELNLAGTQVTRKGGEMLDDALPDCHVVYPYVEEAENRAPARRGQRANSSPAVEDPFGGRSP
jgi:hypothetical protein